MKLYFTIPVFLLFGLFSLYLTIWLKQKKRIHTVYTRKIFHLLIFTAAGLIMLVWGTIPVFIFGFIISCLIIFTIIRGSKSSFHQAIARNSDLNHSSMNIILPFVSTAIGGAASVLIFGKFSLVGFLISGWGDGIAEPVGIKWGLHKYKTPPWGKNANYKSVEGSASVFIVGIIAAVFALLLLEIPLKETIIIAVCCSFVSTITEAFSLHGTDNLTVQFAASGSAYIIFFQLMPNI